MRRLLLPLLALAVLASPTACSPAPSPAGPPPWWNVARGFVRDPQGRAVVLRGANVSNAHKQAPWLDTHTAEDYLRLRTRWRLNSIRFLLQWAALEPERGRFDAAYLDAVAERMRWAREAGLLVVLDLHQDVFGVGFAAGGGNGFPRWTCDEARYAAFQPYPTWWLNYAEPQVMACFDAFWTSDDLKAAYAETWRQVALRFAAESAVLGFDVINEPWSGTLRASTFDEEYLQPLYGQVVAAVRTAAPHWIAFLEPGWTRGAGIATGLRPPEFADAVYAPHSYDPDASHGLGFDPARREALLAYDRSLADDARALGVPLWFGEYAGDPSKPGFSEYLDTQYEAFSAAGAGSAWYHYGRVDDDYSMLDATGAVREPVAQVLVRPYPERVAGDAVSWSHDRETSVFTVTWTPDAAVSAPTEIVVPAPCYPAGYTVECAGCQTEQAPELLRIVRGPAHSPATLVLRRRR